MKLLNLGKIALRTLKNPFGKVNLKIFAQFIVAIFFIGVGTWFVKHEHAELSQIKASIGNASWQWTAVGIFITLLYILLQGLMYVQSFRAVNAKISVKDAVVLFLKRNFISVFIPAGGFSSLLFFTKALEKRGNSKAQINLASSIYAFIGILSVVLIALPIFIYALIKDSIGNEEWLALGATIMLLSIMAMAYKSITGKGWIYKITIRWLPKAAVFIGELENNKISRKNFFMAATYSVLIEFAGIAHLYTAMAALHFQPTLLAASIGYVISVIFLILSPFMRGLGAIEVSMSYILMRYGFSNVEAISITVLYRLFEFWMPLLAGILSFFTKINKLLLRIIPALLLLVLGIINIVSVLTPAIHERLARLKNYLPLEAIHASNYLVFIAGLFLLVTASAMLRGLRTAWWFALVLSGISFVGHITKAIDYEEASIAFAVILILLNTRKEYYIKANPKLQQLGIQTAILSIIAVMLYGTIGFYFLDKNHFGIDFSLAQSVRYTLENYFLIGCTDLAPADDFSTHFLASLKISGLLSLGFLIYTLIKPYVFKNAASAEEMRLAKELVGKYGNSSLDYFKTYNDKLFFISPDKESFIAYKLAGNYAVVLENPVAATKKSMKECIVAFDSFCYESGLESIYYRVGENELELYKSLEKKSFFLGQEGIVDLTEFTLEGPGKKSLRNALNKITESGLKASILLPPIKEAMLHEIKSVSDQWLEENNRKEITFSQGIFSWNELKNQTIVAVEDTEGRIIAFLNIIPDAVRGEATYDLIRKKRDAPNGIIDFILVALFKYLKSENFTSVNLGLAPMSGIKDPQTIQERSMKFAYEKIKSFSHHKGQRLFKEKFSPAWHDKYIIFSDDYDLIQLPRILAKVIKN